MTKTHLKPRELDSESTEQLFLDLDMSILAADREDYDVYTQNVRKEYSHFDDENFVKGRSHFLKGLDGVKIFRSGLFADLNQKAEENIKWELGKLENFFESDL